MKLNNILELNGIDPRDVSVILHTPTNPRLRRMLPWIVAEREDLFEAYQSVHSLSVESTLKKRKFALSFVDTGGANMVLAGLYDVTGWKDRPLELVFSDPLFNELSGLEGCHAGDISRSLGLETRCIFDLQPNGTFSQYIGKLAIAKPKGRTYVRLAENLNVQIVALFENNSLFTAPPEWSEFITTGPEFRVLPSNWASKLREWRGIYLIVDESDGARYVGSAYGEENLLGRWRAHVAGDQGVTKELKKRDPANFRFSILQLLAPDAEPSDVINIEHNWMNRLHTREHGLNA